MDQPLSNTRALLKAVLWGALFGVALSFAQTFVRSSRLSAYRQVELGMPQQDAIDRLRKAGVVCDGTSARCSFDDPSREYHVRFDSQGIVRMKYFIFKPPPTLISMPRPN